MTSLNEGDTDLKIEIDFDGKSKYCNHSAIIMVLV
jgi:hypothetical protein